MNRSKRAAINVAASILQQIIAIICGLITPRLILQSFGSTYNGVISSITQLLSMVSFLTLGFAGAVRAELYRSLAKNDHEDISRIMKAATQYMHKVGGAVVVYAIILAAIYPLISHNDLSPLECALLICFIAVDTFSLYYFGSANFALLIADQRGYVQSIVASVITILNTVVIALVIRIGGNIFIVKAISALIYSMTPALIALYVRHHYRLDTKCNPRKDALKKQGAAAVHSVANIIHDNTDTLILTLFLDAKLLSVYAVYYAVVEKEPSIAVMRYGGKWKDLGTWNTLTEAMQVSSIGKAVLADTCEDVHVINELDVPILCLGLKNMVIAASPEGILVTDKNQSSYIKPFVEAFHQPSRYPKP